MPRPQSQQQSHQSLYEADQFGYSGFKLGIQLRNINLFTSILCFNITTYRQIVVIFLIISEATDLAK